MLSIRSQDRHGRVPFPVEVLAPSRTHPLSTRVLGAATVLSATFDWPDILREPAGVVLPAFVAGGTSLVWTWFALA